MDINNEYGLKELHSELLTILIDFDKICRDNGILYSLAYGSLLGGVRHNGFIPWDDDIDIMVDRENYNKLIKYLKSTKTQDYKFEQDLWIPKITRLATINGKEIKIFLDIFIIDNVPDSKLFAKFKLLSVLLLEGMLKSGLNTKNSIFNIILSVICLILGFPFSKKRKQKWFNKVSQWGNKSHTCQVKCYNAIYSDLLMEYHPSNIMDNYINIPFEGFSLMGIKEYDVYLKDIYGDYLTPPPVDERKPLHITL